MIVSRVPGDIWYDRAGNQCHYRDDGSLCVTTVNNEPSMTIQSEKDSCDVNKIVKKFKATGIMSNVNTAQPISDAFGAVSDFHSAMNSVIAAQEAFMELPATVRKRFANDPGNLLSFLDDPSNAAEAVKLGLVVAPQASQVPQGDATPPQNEGG